ncbi:ribosome silencing factor [Calderihabitans maritimus]|uniref:Ribosomal silencing factor RsfS n=1 Tax=Calderihabitans maritimus TaxID=1246530 RepID=A0A1Z5HSV8_9FIRM|nr:ribosome silencing factor [Calderihabitans maritimus]GAW92395.1 ribosomal silencing factor RsfS [Calderihabitans maritimus]
MTDAKAIALAAAEAAEEKKAKDIVVLDMQKVSLITDYFVIATGNSTTQVQAIVKEIEKKLKEQGIPLLRREGYREARWVLLDYGSVVIHIFQPEEREFYSLERLWGDAPRVSL